jgi:hypothetical protein
MTIAHSVRAVAQERSTRPRTGLGRPAGSALCLRLDALGPFDKHRPLPTWEPFGPFCHGPPILPSVPPGMTHLAPGHPFAGASGAEAFP